jgi:hypothetical protein
MNPLKWRKMTWVLNVWNAIFLIWIVGGIASRPSKNCATDPDVINGLISKHVCEAASDAGTGIGVGLIIFLWFLGFMVISVIWFMTRPKGRMCPHCGEDVKKGLTACKKCGYDYTVGGKPTPQTPLVSGTS